MQPLQQCQVTAPWWPLPCWWPFALLPPLDIPLNLLTITKCHFDLNTIKQSLCHSLLKDFQHLQLDDATPTNDRSYPIPHLPAGQLTVQAKCHKQSAKRPSHASSSTILPAQTIPCISLNTDQDVPDNWTPAITSHLEHMIQTVWTLIWQLEHMLYLHSSNHPLF